MEKNDRLIRNTAEFAERIFKQEYSGHDWFHTYRVWKMAERIALEEGAELAAVAAAALLHDVDDRKLSPQTYSAKQKAVDFLRSQGCDEQFISEVVQIISEVSFRGTDSVVPATIEGKCVQDADRLDAIGAIGIARAFAYGGNHSREMHNPDIPPECNMNEETYFSRESTTVNHFYEKLLLLKDMMTTDTGRKIAEQRDAFMRLFLKEFLDEWDGSC